MSKAIGVINPNGVRTPRQNAPSPSARRHNAGGVKMPRRRQTYGAVKTTVPSKPLWRQNPGSVESLVSSKPLSGQNASGFKNLGGVKARRQLALCSSGRRQNPGVLKKLRCHKKSRCPQPWWSQNPGGVKIMLEATSQCHLKRPVKLRPPLQPGVKTPVASTHP